jgi:hypothetical protein
VLGGIPPGKRGQRKPSEPLDWLTLWAVGRYDLRLSEADFWKLTFKKLDALLKRRQFDIDTGDRQAALICAVLANIHRDPKKSRAYTVQDFLPQKPKSPEELLEKVKTLHGIYEVKNG